MLLQDENTVSQLAERKHKCGFLKPGSFDAEKIALKFGFQASEAEVTDPQQILALHLTAKCFEDAGAHVHDEVLAAPDRCGVYIGAWQEPCKSSKLSAYKV